MTLSEFEPGNPLETMIVQAKQGAVPMDALLAELGRAQLFVSSRREVMADGSGLEPLLLEKDGSALVAVFSSLERPALHRNQAKYVLQMPGRDVFLRLPPQYGVILNPGYVAQLIMTPEAVENFKLRLTPAPA